MIRVEPLAFLSPNIELLLHPYSAQEYALAEKMAEEIFTASEYKWAVFASDTLLCYAGLLRPVFSSPPFLWVLLGKNLTALRSRAVREATKLLRESFPATLIAVETSFRRGHRFAQFCGLAPTGKTFSVAGREFEYYEVI